MHRGGDSLCLMLVDINQWRAAIGNFRALTSKSERFCVHKPFELLLHIFKLYLSASCFTLTSATILPFTIALYVLLCLLPNSEPYFLQIFSSTYWPVTNFANSFSEQLKHASDTIDDFLRSNRRKITYFSLLYCLSYGVCIAIDILHFYWVAPRLILLCCDVNPNPGPDTFKFCCWNLNSIIAYDFLQVTLIEAYNSLYNYDLLGIVETHLDDTIDQERLALKGYNLITCNHPLNIKRGGVGLYIKESLSNKRRPDMTTLSECIVCELHLDRKKYFFVVLYRSPSQDQDEFECFMNKFELMLSNMSAEEPYAIVIMGDFNCRSPQWWENDIENYEGKQFEPLVSDLGLHQLISGPTHIIGDSKSCIDLIFTDQPNLFIYSDIHPSLHEQCHHQMIHAKLSVRNAVPPPYTRKLWFYDRADITSIQTSVKMFRWQETFEEVTHPDKQVEVLNEVLLNICSNFIPNELKRIKPKQVPWITPNIKNFLRKKNRAFKSFIKKGQPEDMLAGLQDMIAQGSKLVENAKHKYFIKIGGKLSDPSTGAKNYWSLIKKITNKANIPEVPPLLENDIFVQDFATKAQIFNDHFLLQCTPLDTGSEIPGDLHVTTSLVRDFLISDEKILSIIRNLNPNKAHGWDDIPIRVIKMCDDSLITPLKLIFENCLCHGIFPEIWKRANVVPVHKKGEKNLKENYRPISLLPIFGKILEKLIYESLYSHLEMENLLNPNQSGFRPGDSTINQLLSITHSIQTALDSNPTLEVRSVFLDISKAFDKVWHEGLIYKLRRCGVAGNLLLLLQNFLSNRKQRTVLNGQSSAWGNVKAGVPQGSILGPLLFLIYINDLVQNLRCKVKLFADDTSLFTTVQDPQVAARDLNHDLDLISSWANKWKMSFNPDPSKQAVELIFSRKNTKINHPVLCFNKTPVLAVLQHKHLGMILDTKLSFSSHIQAAITKSRKAIGMLKFMSKYLPRSTLDQLYKLYVRPHLDYGDVIYHTPKNDDAYSENYQMEKLESVQYSAALAVSGTWRGTSKERLYEELGWESLSARRWYRRLVLLYKFTNNLTPEYTRAPIPALHVSNYSLRAQPVMGQIRTRTEKFRSSFYPNSLLEWNRLDPETRESPSLSIFKKKLLLKIRPVYNSVYGIYNPKGVSFLTQLRVGLSKLNYHKFRHNFADTMSPMCPANDGIEDTEHFLLLCHAFNDHRRSLLAGVGAVLNAYGIIMGPNYNILQTLLYGEKALNVEANKQILELTIKYIIETKRLE